MLDYKLSEKQAISDPIKITALPDWPRVPGQGGINNHITARIRNFPEDFQVNEELGFLPEGEGEHLYLQIRKRNRNTDQVVREVARHAGVRVRDVGYCGLKDRHAVTTQWLSVWLPGKPDPEWDSIEDDNLQIVEQVRHSRKLQRGALSRNIFQIVLREVGGDRNNVEQRLESIKQNGAPNYFGEQRFGRNGDNLKQVEAMFNGRKIRDRHLRSLYLSSARSYLFNEVLARRVEDGTWNTIIPGEAVMLSGSHSYFICDEINEEIMQRLSVGDIHPSGPLWGKGDLPVKAQAKELENAILLPYTLFCNGLEKAGMKQERRALRLLVNDLQWTWLSETDLQLNFSLPAGTFATAVLREVCEYQ